MTTIQRRWLAAGLYFIGCSIIAYHPFLAALPWWASVATVAITTFLAIEAFGGRRAE